MTDYLILQKHPATESDLWTQLDGIHRASSAKRALDGANLDQEGWYVAVPVRNWKPLPVKVESKRVVTVG